MNIKEKIKERKLKIENQNSKFSHLLEEVKTFCSDFSSYDYEEINDDKFGIKYNGLCFIIISKYSGTPDFIHITNNSVVAYTLQYVERRLESLLFKHYCKNFLDKPQP